MSAQLLNSVNQHYLDRLLDVSKSKTVIFNEDIYNEKGIKLVAKNTQLSETLKDWLLQSTSKNTYYT